MPNSKRSINGIPLGMWVRNQIGKAFIFRVRRGNGSYGAIAGHRYQDKYTYFVPLSVNNLEGEPSRANFRAAVDYWKNILTVDEKRAYNKRAFQYKGYVGYNLFMKEALTGVFEMFVDRGDPASVDFSVGDFTKDGAWHDLDVSAIVPATARLLLIEVDFQSTNAAREIEVKKYGQTNDFNHADVETFIGDNHQSGTLMVAMDSNRKFSYKIDAATWAQLDMIIRGWWT